MTVNRQSLKGRIPKGGQSSGSRVRMAHKTGSKKRGSSRKSQRRQRPKRRYDILLPAAAGAEVRLPAIPQLRVGARLLTAWLLAGVLWAGYSLLTGSAFRVDQPEVHGAEFMSEAHVRSIAAVDDTVVFFVDPEQIAESLYAYAEISAVEVAVEWPNKVVIHLVERKPIVAWDDGGRRWWLCADGVAILEREVRPGLVQIISDEPTLQIQDDPLAQVIDPEVLRSAVALRTLLPEIGSLRFERDRGLVLDDSRGWTAYFGAEGDMAQKVRVYIRVSEWLQEHAVRASMVSMLDPSSPYYTLAR